jgi:hypothetical protein
MLQCMSHRLDFVSECVMTTPDEFLESAKAIDAISNSASCDDALSRAVVSRGYYAAYHAACEVRDRLVLPPPGKNAVGSHARVFQSLLECTSGHSDEYNSVRSIGMMAARILKPYRTSADYDLKNPLPHMAKSETLARAALVLQKSASIKPK